MNETKKLNISFNLPIITKNPNPSREELYAAAIQKAEELLDPNSKLFDLMSVTAAVQRQRHAVTGVFLLPHRDLILNNVVLDSRGELMQANVQNGRFHLRRSSDKTEWVSVPHRLSGDSDIKNRMPVENQDFIFKVPAALQGKDAQEIRQWGRQQLKEKLMEIESGSQTIAANRPSPL